MTSSTYLLAGQPSELERLQLQSQVWEPSGRRLVAELGEGAGRRAVDVGCGVLGWLRVLGEWVGADGEVVGTDIDPAMLSQAAKFVADEGLANVTLLEDDLFSTALEPASFDLVHARFELAPLGRGREQLAVYSRLAKPGGVVVLEDLDVGSWHFNPPAPAAERLIDALVEGFSRSGGDVNAGRKHVHLLREAGIEPDLRAEVLALEPGHPYLRVPIQMAIGLRPKLEPLVGADELDRLLAAAEAELQVPDRWGTTFTLLQAWGRKAA